MKLSQPKNQKRKVKKMVQKPGSQSDEYKAQEEKNRQAKVAAENEAEAEKVIIYWHQAKRGQMGNFVPEIRSGGVIVQSEEPLQFENHIHSTSDPAVVDFIEGVKDDKGSWVRDEAGKARMPHRSFRDGTVVRCKDMSEAMSKTAAIKAVRGGVKEYQSVVSISPKGTSIAVPSK